MPKLTGAFFFLAGFLIFMGITTAEIFYPTIYSISQNMISNLGSTPPPQGIVHQPSARIFDYSLIAAGALIIAAVLLSRQICRSKLLTLTIAGMGLGTLGVGIFPAFHATAHPIAALLSFVGGGVSAVISSRHTSRPFATIALVMGIASLSFLVIGLFNIDRLETILGPGGTERWVAYPVTLWLTGFGGYLMSSSKSRDN